MENDLISRVEVLKLIEDIKMNPEVPKNYGTLLDIMKGIRELPPAFDVNKVIKELEELRDLSEGKIQYCEWKKGEVMKEAADTIEALSAKLSAANDELKRWHTEHINENIKNSFAQTSTLICYNCDHKDEYIEELEAENMKRSEEYYKECELGNFPITRMSIPKKIIEAIEEKAGFYITSEGHFLSALSRILNVNTLKSSKELWPNANNIKISDCMERSERYYNGGWIPCKERIPFTRNNLLVCQKDGYVSVGYYSQGQFLDLNSNPFENVIAWCELPEPYHEP